MSILPYMSSSRNLSPLNLVPAKAGSREPDFRLPAYPWIPGQARNDKVALRPDFRLPAYPWIPGQARNDKVALRPDFWLPAYLWIPGQARNDTVALSSQE